MTPKNSTAHLFRNIGPLDQPINTGRSDAEIISQMETDAVNRGPLQLQSVEDPFLLDKLKSLLLPAETILAFCGRCGLGPRPLREWSLERIANFLAQQDQQEKPPNL